MGVYGSSAGRKYKEVESTRRVNAEQKIPITAAWTDFKAIEVEIQPRCDGVSGFHGRQLIGGNPWCTAQWLGDRRVVDEDWSKFNWACWITWKPLRFLSFSTVSTCLVPDSINGLILLLDSDKTRRLITLKVRQRIFRTGSEIKASLMGLHLVFDRRGCDASAFEEKPHVPFGATGFVTKRIKTTVANEPVEPKIWGTLIKVVVFPLIWRMFSLVNSVAVDYCF